MTIKADNMEERKQCEIMYERNGYLFKGEIHKFICNRIVGLGLFKKISFPSLEKWVYSAIFIYKVFQ